MRYLEHLCEWIKQAYPFLITMSVFVGCMIPAIFTYHDNLQLIPVTIFWAFTVFGVPYVIHRSTPEE